jgi:DNA (cytosine-5)-methyltransferase 1
LSKKIRVIDVFAGPGGLGEGFSACRKNSPFEIVMSVEAEENAHKTLTHRAFYRRLPPRGKPELTRCNTLLDKADRQRHLMNLKEKYSSEWQEAQDETLGEPTRLGNARIWQKLEEGQALTEEDKEDTEAQTRVSNRIKQIRAMCKRDKTPLMVIGGPPCQSYSNAGRNRVRAIEGYKTDEDQRFFLYKEYARVLAEAKPDVFIMENVQGILSAKLANGDKIIPQILETLKRPSSYSDTKKDGKPEYHLYSLSTPPDGWIKDEPVYKNSRSFLISADQYGVPQTRKRVIILGVKASATRLNPVLQKSQNFMPSVRDVIDSLPSIRSTITNRSNVAKDSEEAWRKDWSRIKQTLIEKLADVAVKKYLRNVDSKAELSVGSGRFVPANSSGFSEQFDKQAETNPEHASLRKWILGSGSSGGFYNHIAKSHQYHDRLIYMFAAAFTNVHGVSPKASRKDESGEPEFPKFLAPNHRNWESGDYADRFRCLLPDSPAKTITSHLKKDGHAYIHYDPTQNRCLSPREAARIQTFPDDYFFEGGAGAQYQQVGNAVPPYLAKNIALVVSGIFCA